MSVGVQSASAGSSAARDSRREPISNFLLRNQGYVGFWLIAEAHVDSFLGGMSNWQINPSSVSVHAANAM